MLPRAKTGLPKTGHERSDRSRHPTPKTPRAKNWVIKDGIERSEAFRGLGGFRLVGRVDSWDLNNTYSFNGESLWNPFGSRIPSERLEDLSATSESI
jgi:hypothetical protein